MRRFPATAVWIALVAAAGLGCGQKEQQGERAGAVPVPGAGAGAVPGAGAGAVPGADPSAGAIPNAGADPGADPGAGTGADPGAGTGADPGAAGATGTRPRCVSVPFAVSLDLPEASGATYVADLDGKGPALVVVSDSGNDGAYLILDPGTGAIKERGKLPLDEDASDDLEGASWLAGELVVITSSGYLRHFKRKGGAFTPSRRSYALGEGHGKHRLSCGARQINCAPNYEGLCLAPAPVAATGCAGFAASKSHGTLVCLVRGKDGALSADPARGFKVAAKEALTGCHYLAPDKLLAGTNLFALSKVMLIDHASDAKARAITDLGSLGSGFPEAIAASPEGLIYRLSDTGSAPSLVDAHRCE